MAFFQDTFASDAVDTSPPSGWGNPSPTANGIWAIKDAPPHFMRYLPNNNTPSSVGWTAVGSNRVFNFEGVITNADAFNAGVAASGFLFDDSGFQNRIHVFLLESGAAILIVYKDGAQISNTTLYSSGTFLPLTSKYRIKTEYDGNAKTFHVKIWADGGSEPSFLDHSDKLSTWTANPNLGVRAFGNPDSSTGFLGVYSTQLTSFQTVAITGTSAALSTVTGAAAVGRSITSTSAAQSSVTGLAGLQRPIAATSDALSNVTGTANVQKGMATTCAAQSAVTGAMTVQRNMAATSDALSNVSGTLNATWGMAATSDALSSVTGTANITWGLDSTSAAQSAVTGTVIVAMPLTTTISGQSATSGALSVNAGITGTTQAASAADGSIEVSRPLDATITAISFTIATLDAVNAKLDGTITAVSTVVLLELKAIQGVISAHSVVQAADLDRLAILRINAESNFETHLIAQKPS